MSNKVIKCFTITNNNSKNNMDKFIKPKIDRHEININKIREQTIIINIIKVNKK